MSGVTSARWLIPCQRVRSGSSSVTAMHRCYAHRFRVRSSRMSPAEVSFDDLLLVMAGAVAVRLLLGLVPRVPIPSSGLEIAAGIVIGPALLGWVSNDAVINVFAKLGVALLLFLAGLELDFRKLRGQPLQLALLAFAASLVI